MCVPLFGHLKTVVFNVPMNAADTESVLRVGMALAFAPVTTATHPRRVPSASTGIGVLPVRMCALEVS